MFNLLLGMIYISFISLGLPDSLLGSAWPSIYPQLQVPISYAGIISVIISVGTIFSSLQSDRLTLRFGTGKVTAVSVAVTAAALLGFSFADSFWMLCLLAIPYGLGAGSVDASLNNYVALHYESKHMSWLHCMWGIGATTGPYVMGFALTGGFGWNMGYRIIGLFQVVLAGVLLAALPLWKAAPRSSTEDTDRAPMPARRVLRIPGVLAMVSAFFCYCAVEQTTGLWAASYLNLYRGLPADTAASFAGLFFLGITVGRAISGFITMKLRDEQMIWLGMGIILCGIAAMVLPGPGELAFGGLILIGLGCAPIYPCMIHSTPARFGADRSQAIIGVQMACAYVGNCLMPPLFGVLADVLTTAMLPWFLLGILAVMAVCFRVLTRKAPAKEEK